MAGKNTAAKVEELAAPFARELGLDIWDVTFTKEGTDWYLRIFIDKSDGVNIDDCVALTHAVSAPLDEADLIAQSYTLEVSSPGVERELKKDSHFEKYINSPVTLRTIRPIDGVRDFGGVLKKYDGGTVTVELGGGKEIAVNKKDTAYVKLDDLDSDNY